MDIKEVRANVRAMRPDLFSRCQQLGAATKQTIEMGYPSNHVAGCVEDMAVMLVALALNLRAGASVE